MESDTVINSSLAGSSPACAGCELWKRHLTHKTTRERVIEFYGHMPTQEELDRDRPERVSWGPPVGREIW
jgi:hypothetical protein